MKISNIFEQNETIGFNEYLKKCGVQDITEYLEPTRRYIDDCYLYNNITEAVQIIKYYKLLDTPTKVVIVQDGDGDGVCSSVILYQYLSVAFNFDIKVLIHTSKQRGLDDIAIMNQIESEKPNIVFIPDAGTNNRSQAEKIKEMGADLIVLDHHKYETPIEYGILVSNQDKNSKVQRGGSGALVTHKFLQALDKEFDYNYASYLVDLVALSLISDSMNMAEMENRTYYYYGLETKDCITNYFLIKMFEKFIGDKEYTQRDISFKIVPKINSICRHKNMDYKKRLFLAFIGADDIDEVLDICEQAHKDQINTVNDIIEQSKDEIEKLSNDAIVFYASDMIPRSYSGLVCGKIMNLVGGKPTIVGSIKNNEFIGSLRSPIPLRTELANNDLVEFCSGHECSAGFGIDVDNIKPLIDYYNAVGVDCEPCMTVLATYPIKSMPKFLYGEFSRYNALWGKGIEKPIFYITDIVINPSTDIRIIGSNKRTLKINTPNTDLLIFNCKKEDKTNLGLGYYENDVFVEDRKNEKIKINCIGTLGVNEWNGKKYNQIIVDNYEIMEYNNKRTINDIF